MHYADLLSLVIIGAAGNRARGSRFWNMLSSTELGRIGGMGLIAGAASEFYFSLHFPISISYFILPIIILVGLLLWCSAGWDDYWSAAIGNDPHHSRLWGVGTLALRMLLGSPLIAALCWYTGHPEKLYLCMAPALMALPYFVFGYISKVNSIPRAEYTVGAMWGYLFFVILA